MEPLTVHCPTRPEQVTLGQWTAFVQNHGKELDARYEAIMEGPETDREFDLADLQLDRMYLLAGHFSGLGVRRARRQFTLGQVTDLYREVFAGFFEQEPESIVRSFTWNEQTWALPPVEVLPNGPHTFGEFIDGKVSAQESKKQEGNRWELVLQVAVIFLRPEGEAYDDRKAAERAELMAGLPLSIAVDVGRWFEAFNRYIEEQYPVFHPSNIKGGRFMKRHFEEWGLIHFLKSIAETKIFDVPSLDMNSIECARRAPLHDVLMLASEDKSRGEAEYWDMEESTGNKKRFT